MFDDLKLIAVLNIAYCVLSLLGILSECVQQNGKYCPYFRINPILQWFNIIFVLYLRGVIKTCLNIQYLVFAFDRYLTTLNSTDETDFIKNTKKFLETKKFKLLVSLFSFGSSIFVFFEFSVNFYAFSYSFPLNILRWYKKVPIIMFAFKGINYLVNNIVFLLLEIFIDIILAKSVKKAMEQKEKISINKNSQDEKNQTVLRTNLMVIINCLMLIFFRFIDLSLIIVDFDKGDQKKQYNFCFYYPDFDFCSIFLKFGDLCFILSNFFNFFIYLTFNRKFRECFIALFKYKNIIKKY